MNKYFRNYGIIGCFLLSITGHSQNCDFNNLVFEGAGIRGIAYAGVVEELEKHDMLKDLDKVGGTSAGALTALMVSLGYSSKEIAEIISSTKFQNFNDGRFFFIGGFLRIKKFYGWYRGERLSRFIAGIVEGKSGNPELTFEELNANGYKDLYITATSLNRQKLVVLSKENYPKMKIKDAVRISMSIPLYFKAVFVDSAGAVYKKPDKINDPDIMIDGGVTGNFPISMFDSIAVDPLAGEQRIPDFGTIGVRIDSEQQIENDVLSRELVPLEINNINDYISAFYVFILENLNRNDLTDEDWSRTISVSSEGINPRIRKLKAEQIEKLLESGRRYTADYIKYHCHKKAE